MLIVTKARRPASRQAETKASLVTSDQDVLPQNLDKLDRLKLVSLERTRKFAEFGEASKTLIAIFLPQIIWPMLLMFAMNFFFPYILLVGWKSALFYSLFLAIGSIAQEYMFPPFLSVFNLSRVTIDFYAALAVLLLASSLVADFFLEVSTKPKTSCPHCASIESRSSVFCSSCGYQLSSYSNSINHIKPS